MSSVVWLSIKLSGNANAVGPHAMFNPHFMWDKQIEAKNKVLCGEEKIFFIRQIWLFNIDLEKKMAAHSYSCLENPMDRGAWQAMFHKVAENWAQLKWLSMHAHTTLTSCDIKTF